MNKIEYSGEYKKQTYVLATESCADTVVGHLADKHPNLLNIEYHWESCEGTDYPDFPIDNPVRILNDIWKNICKLDKGTYLIATSDSRDLNIYVRRWLTKKNHFKILERGHVMFKPYVIVSKD